MLHMIQHRLHRQKPTDGLPATAFRAVVDGCKTWRQSSPACWLLRHEARYCLINCAWLVPQSCTASFLVTCHCTSWSSSPVRSQVATSSCCSTRPFTFRGCGSSWLTKHTMMWHRRQPGHCRRPWHACCALNSLRAARLMQNSALAQPEQTQQHEERWYHGRNRAAASGKAADVPDSASNAAFCSRRAWCCFTHM